VVKKVFTRTSSYGDKKMNTDVLAIGGGVQGASLLAGLDVRAPASVRRILVSVTLGDGVSTSRGRIDSCICSELGTSLPNGSRIDVYDQARLLEQAGQLRDVNLVLVQLPLHAEHMYREKQCMPMAEYFARVARLVDPDAIFAFYSATGKYDDESLEAALPGKPRVAYHYLYPASLMPLVEISPLSNGSVDAAQRLAAFFLDCGYEPIVFEQPCLGYLSSRMHVALLNLYSELRKADDRSVNPASFDAAVAKVGAQVYRSALDGTGFPWDNEPVLGEPSEQLLVREILRVVAKEFRVVLDALTRNRERPLSADRAESTLFRALACGPALRWQTPGILRFSDLAGISKFMALVDQIAPGGDTDLLEELVINGRVGVSNACKAGFYTWSGQEEVELVLRQRNAQLRIMRDELTNIPAFA